MKRFVALFVPVLVLIAAFAFTQSAAVGANPHKILRDAATGKLRPAVLKVTTGTTEKTMTMPFISSGTLNAAADALRRSDAGDARAEGADAGADVQLDGSASGGTTTGVSPAHSLGCGTRDSGTPKDVRVNQDCTYRRQAEESVTYDPLHPNNLLAGQNDSRVGFNQCGIDFSTNNGKNWGDLLPPFRQKLNNPAGQEPTASDPNRHTIEGGPGTLHTYDAGSDPAMAMDALGRGYFSCVTFDVASNASGLYVTQSPPGADGSFFFNWTGRLFTVAEDN